MIYFIVNVCNISLYGQYCCIEMNVFLGDKYYCRFCFVCLGFLYVQSLYMLQSQIKVVLKYVSDDLLKLSYCLGVDLLMKLLGNYCRNQNIKIVIRVGVVGQYIFISSSWIVYQSFVSVYRLIQSGLGQYVSVKGSLIEYV